MKYLLVRHVIFISMSLFSFGQYLHAAEVSIADILNESEAVYKKSNPSQNTGQASLNAEVNKTQAERAKGWNQKVMPAWLEFEKNRYIIIEEAFNWHQTASIIIFWVVIIIVAVALIFSWKEFTRDPGEEKGEHELEFSVIGVSLKVKSSFVGLMILSFALIFFYLYIKEVYPINIVNLDGKQSQIIKSK